MVSDLEARWRPLAPDEEAGAQALLEDAWAIANVQLPSLSGNVQSGAVSEDIVRAVVCAMVLRVLRNPDGVRSWSVDDYSQTRDNSVSSGSLYLSDAELALLGTAAGYRRRGAFSVAPAPVQPVRSPYAEFFEDYGPGYLR
jgi:hypothetical protein